MRKFFVLLLSIAVFSAQAQKIEMAEKKHDFGKIKEADGKVKHVFSFKNTGSKPLLLKHVSASCGCTTPDWPRNPIAPGKSADINVVFNPKNRSGNFNKSITISSNAENGEQKVYISGVIEKAPPSLEDYYRQEMGDLRFRSTYAAFTKIKDSEKQTREIEFVNLSENKVRIEAKDLPASIQMEFQPQTVNPKEKGKIAVTFDASKAKQFGYNMNYIYLKLNGKEDRKFRVMVSSNVTEDFSAWTEKQLKNAAHAVFEGAKVQELSNNTKRVTVEHDFGKIQQGDKVEHVFKFTNTGKSDLIIRRTKASCGCTAVAPNNKVIKPGEAGEIKAVFDSRGRSGRQRKSITVILNDPEAPTVKLYINSEIVKS